jgi:hypothetical protein
MPQVFKILAVKVGFSVKLCESSSTQNAQAQQLKIGTSVHTAFDQLESVDMAFEQSIAVGQS